MTTLLSILYNVPILIGVLIAVITLVVIFFPWRFTWERILLALAAICILIIFWFHEAWRAFKKWMRKHEAWEDDLPDLWI